MGGKRCGYRTKNRHTTFKGAQPAQEQIRISLTEYKQAGTDIIKDVQLLYSEAYITMKIFKMLTLH